MSDIPSFYANDPNNKQIDAWSQVDAVFSAHLRNVDEWIEDMQSALTEFKTGIAALEGTDISIDVDWDVEDYTPEGDAGAPPLPTFTGTWVDPTPPPGRDFGNPSPDAIVEYPSAPSAPDFDWSGLPSPWSGTFPTEPDLFTITVPDAPSITLPSPPSLSNIPIPAVPQIDYPTFSETPPDITLTEPEIVTPGEETPYSSAVLTALQNQILTVLTGNRGYLDTIWDMIWERERGNEVETSLAAIEQVHEMWGARGWSVPGGAEADQELAIIQSTQNQNATLARDKAIEQNKQEVERFNFHVAQGIALETVLMAEYSKMWDRNLRRVEIINNALLAFLDARVKIVQLQLSRYQTIAEVYYRQIQAALARLQAYSEEIKGAALIGEIDERKIKIYVAELEGVDKLIKVYLGELDGAKTTSEINKNLIDLLVARVQAVKLEIEANKNEFEGYESKVRAQQGKASVWGTAGQIFSSEVQAVSSENQTRLGYFNGLVDKEKLIVSQVDSDIKKFLGELQATADKWKGYVDAFDVDMKGYAAYHNAQATYTAAKAKKYEADVAKGQAVSSIALAQGQSNAANSLRLAEIEVNALEKISTIFASLVSAAMSALDAQAQISGNANLGVTVSKEFQCDSPC